VASAPAATPGQFSIELSHLLVRPCSFLSFIPANGYGLRIEDSGRDFH
jgi:hypothetical protein